MGESRGESGEGYLTLNRKRKTRKESRGRVGKIGENRGESGESRGESGRVGGLGGSRKTPVKLGFSENTQF